MEHDFRISTLEKLVSDLGKVSNDIEPISEDVRLALLKEARPMAESVGDRSWTGENMIFTDIKINEVGLIKIYTDGNYD